MPVALATKLPYPAIIGNDVPIILDLVQQADEMMSHTHSAAIDIYSPHQEERVTSLVQAVPVRTKTSITVAVSI